MDIFAAFATDEKKENEGAWFDVPGGDARILVARSNNMAYARALLKSFEKYAKADKDDEEIQKQQTADFVKVLARHILLGWEKVQFKSKLDYLPYSTENAEKLLSIKEFREFVQRCADDFEAYRVTLEEEVGNS